MAVEWFLKSWPDRWTRIKAVLLVNPKINIKQKYEELKQAKHMEPGPTPF